MLKDLPSRDPPTFSASCSNSRSWKHWSSWSLRTCQAWWRCCRVEWSLSSSWVIRGTRPCVSVLHIPPLLLLLLPPLPPPPPLRLEKDSLLWILWSNLEMDLMRVEELLMLVICCNCLTEQRFAFVLKEEWLKGLAWMDNTSADVRKWQIFFILPRFYQGRHWKNLHLQGSNYYRALSVLSITLTEFT